MKDRNDPVDCPGRREFLVRAALVAGGLALTLSGAASVFGKPFEQLVVTIDDQSPLGKVGGATVVDSSVGKIIIVRTGELTFVAYSARCTHKNGIVDYDSVKKEFVCPKHGSTFDVATGNALDGPADEPLPAYRAAGASGSVTVNIGA